jgi:hypothetical protein
LLPVEVVSPGFFFIRSLSDWLCSGAAVKNNAVGNSIKKIKGAFML